MKLFHAHSKDGRFRGKIHGCTENADRTLCGYMLSEYVRGGEFVGENDGCGLTCVGCIKVMGRHERYEAERREFEEERAKRSRLQEKAYDLYMSSPEWTDKRKAVLRRAHGICEGCGRRPAIQAHHLTYQRFGREMLFDLVAVCLECHALIHWEPEE
jgi:hypothetical protein